MASKTHRENPINGLLPGTRLLDRQQGKEKVLRRFESHGSFVRLFFEHDEHPFMCSSAELQVRFEIVERAFGADANLVRLVAEAHRLRHAYLFNPIFATETSLIDPLPHQFIAVYDHLLKPVPLRFLLADDAGAGKTIMTGLYIQELLLRRQVQRVLIVPPAGLVGNWERELRVYFRLHFQIMSSADATDANPFLDSQNRLAIVSLDTLRQERMQECLFDAQPYELVVFDEAHKLSARVEWDGTVFKSKRYELAERIAAQRRRLLLLTATPHMGKNDAYYFLWRLLLPDRLAAQKALDRFSEAEKSKHLLRRMKEEMVTFDGALIFPPRMSRTITYPLKQGEVSSLLAGRPGGVSSLLAGRPGGVSEQSLYDRVTEYCQTYFDLAGQYNRTAAQMAMMVLQRRLASSTFALLRSLIRREEKLRQTLEELRAGRLSTEMFSARQRQLPEDDIREAKTGEEEETVDGQEESERHDEDIVEATSARSISDLETELGQVQHLVALARAVYNKKSESKFEKLWEALGDYPDTKVLIFTEHRDTLDFVTARLEALGFSGKVAHIHGGMRYPEREKQVEFFRDVNGAQYLVATDAAGEGINLQFCWLMVNYDIPWNPARLEQRMGRIHRYKQRHTVVLLNLVAQDTREGRVLKVLLEKLEQMRQELSDDKVFDVIGQQFSSVSLTSLITDAITQNRTDASIEAINRELTKEAVEARLNAQRQQVACHEVKRLLEGLSKQRESAETRRMMPAYVRRFFEDVAPLVGYGIDGDIEGIFKLSPCPESVEREIEAYPPHLRDRLTFSPERATPDDTGQPRAIFLHPGEPLFESVMTHFLGEFGDAGERGAVYLDPETDAPYLFYLAKVPVLRHTDPEPQVLDEVLVGVKQFADGRCESTPAHLLLTLTPQSAPRARHSERSDESSERSDESRHSERSDESRHSERSDESAISPQWVDLADEVQPVETFVRDTFGEPKRTRICDDLRGQLAHNLKQLKTAFNLRKAELLRQRQNLKDAVARAVPAAQTKLNECETELGQLAAKRTDAEAGLIAEIENTQLGPVTLYVRALVTPPPPIDAARTKAEHDAEIIAVQTAIAYERQHAAEIEDVSNPALKKGFDLESRRPDGEVRYIEVKGRTGVASVELTENEWRQAANHQDRYWLYVVYHCESNPQLYRCRDPFGNLIAKAKGSVMLNASDIISNQEP